MPDIKLELANARDLAIQVLALFADSAVALPKGQKAMFTTQPQLIFRNDERSRYWWPMTIERSGTGEPRSWDHGKYFSLTYEIKLTAILLSVFRLIDNKPLPRKRLWGLLPPSIYETHPDHYPISPRYTRETPDRPLRNGALNILRGAIRLSLEWFNDDTVNSVTYKIGEHLLANKELTEDKVKDLEEKVKEWRAVPGIDRRQWPDNAGNPLSVCWFLELLSGLTETGTFCGEESWILPATTGIEDNEVGRYRRIAIVKKNLGKWLFADDEAAEISSLVVEGIEKCRVLIYAFSKDLKSCKLAVAQEDIQDIHPLAVSRAMIARNMLRQLLGLAGNDPATRLAFDGVAPPPDSLRNELEKQTNVQMALLGRSALGDLDAGQLLSSLEGRYVCDDSPDQLHVMIRTVLAALADLPESERLGTPRRPLVRLANGGMWMTTDSNVFSTILRLVERLAAKRPYSSDSYEMLKLVEPAIQKAMTRFVTVVTISKTDSDRKRQRSAWLPDRDSSQRFIRLETSISHLLLLLHWLTLRNRQHEAKIIELMNSNFNITPYLEGPLSPGKKKMPPEIALQRKVWQSKEPLLQLDSRTPYTKIFDKFIEPRSDSSKTVKERNAASKTLLLFGPPGTGKTTIADWIADSLAWPIMSLSPADFRFYGAELIDARAKEIIAGLRELHNVVVLFDEIEDLLTDRDNFVLDRDSTVTSGVLPQLVSLRESGRGIFVIATNYWERIDLAIRRAGRIDESCLILPPAFEVRYQHFADSLAEALIAIESFAGLTGEEPSAEFQDLNKLPLLKEVAARLALKTPLWCFSELNMLKGKFEKYLKEQWALKVKDVPSLLAYLESTAMKNIEGHSPTIRLPKYGARFSKLELSDAMSLDRDSYREFYGVVVLFLEPILSVKLYKEDKDMENESIYPFESRLLTLISGQDTGLGKSLLEAVQADGSSKYRWLMDQESAVQSLMSPQGQSLMGQHGNANLYSHFGYHLLRRVSEMSPGHCSTLLFALLPELEWVKCLSATALTSDPRDIKVPENGITAYWKIIKENISKL